MSRGLRNSNPGNIRVSKTRYLGEVESSDSAFKQFKSMEWGYRAMFVLLYTYQKRHNLQTIAEMIERYAPPSENFTGAYIRFVERSSGVKSGDRVDTTNGEIMKRVVAAMSQIENGRVAVQSDVERGWELFERHRP